MKGMEIKRKEEKDKEETTLSYIKILQKERKLDRTMLFYCLIPVSEDRQKCAF